MSTEIIVLMSAFYHGGAEVQYKRLASGLAENGFRVELWALQRPTQRDLRELEQSEIEFRLFSFDFLRYQNRRAKPFFYLVYYLKLTGMFLLQLRKSQAKVLISYGMLLAPFIPLFKVFKWKVLFSCRTATSILKKRRYLATFYNMADAVVTNASQTSKYLEQIGVARSKVTLVNNGIHINGSPGFEVNRPARIVALIGRIHPIKNHLFVLESLRCYPEYEIVFVGQISNQAYYRLVTHTIDRYNMSNRVQVLGFMDNIETIYRRVDVVVLPSFEEGSSNVILECFKYGKLCIASNIETNQELLHGKGYLIDTADDQSLIRAIKKIDNTDPKRLQAMMEKNFDFLAKNFSVDRQVSRYEELILAET